MQKLLNMASKLLLWSVMLAPAISAAQPISTVACPTFVLPKIDNSRLQEAAQASKQSAAPVTFAHPFEAHITPQSHGHWVKTDAQNWLWELQIHAPTAYSINLGFSEFVLAGNAQLDVYDVHTQAHLGNFTARDNDLHKQLFTPLFDTDFIKISLSVSDFYKPKVKLHLQTVNHAFWDIQKQRDDLSCLIDVVCDTENGMPEVDAYRQAIEAVGLITIDGISLCTGVLLNNTQNNFMPYLLTAEHCGIRPSNAASVVVYWNYQNSYCRPINTPENDQNGDGQRTIFNAGASVKARFNPSDMTLLLLDDPIPSEANIFFAGWQRTWDAPQQTACVHHAGGLEKRFCSDADVPVRSNHFSAPLPNGNHWRVEQWDLGTTETGASGAPLFNEKAQVIGQLHGGDASCSNTEGSDWFGALATSWDGGGSPATQLAPWLDPLALHPTHIDGIYLESVNPLSIGYQIVQQIDCFDSHTGTVALTALGGTPPYQYSKDGILYADDSVFDQLGAGSYIFFVRDATGAVIGTPSVTIVQPSPMSAQAQITGNQVEIQAFGGVPPYQYRLDNEAYKTSPFFLFFEMGNRRFYIKDANDCVIWIDVLVSWESLEVDASVVEPILCHGDSTAIVQIDTPSGVAPFGVFYNGVYQKSNIIGSLPSGTHTFMIVDSALDTVFTEVEIFQPAPLELTLETIDNTILASASGGTSPYEYRIDNETFTANNIFENMPFGTHTVFVRDANRCTANDSVFLEVVATQQVTTDKIRVFPNPARQHIRLEIDGAALSYDAVQIVSANGTILWETDVVQHRFDIDCSTWKSGTYFVQIWQQKQPSSTKIIKY